jgi:UDP-N-acetylglucosamine 2-epimerase (non-hydrolysing)
VRLILVAGARPNLIKVAPLLPAFERAGISADVAFTGTEALGVTVQDPDRMSFWGVTLRTPRWFLGIDEGTSAVETGTALVVLEQLLAAECPDAVLAVGDHNATLALAIAAAKQNIPIVHLEAGLRCGDLGVPEEVNRVLVSRVSALHLACDETGMSHLVDEGVDADRIVLVGSILAESVIRNAEAVRDVDAAKEYGLTPKGYVLASFHCPENLDDAQRCQAIFEGLSALDLPVLMVDVRGVSSCFDVGNLAADESVRIVGPVPYRGMLALIRDAAVVVTDSGGVQEEACMLSTPCVTVRHCTERVATIEVGANRLADAMPDAIVSAVAQAIEGPRKWPTPKRWDKAVSQRVVRSLKRGLVPLR